MESVKRQLSNFGSNYNEHLSNYKDGSHLPIPEKRSRQSHKSSRLPKINEVEEKPSLWRSSSVNSVSYLGKEEKIKCTIDGVTDLELIIDPGSYSNIITDKIWDFFKNHGLQVLNKIPYPDDIFLTYRIYSNAPLTLLGSFETTVKIGPIEKKSTFYIIKGGTRNLLGKKTAMDLKLIKENGEAENQFVQKRARTSNEEERIEDRKRSKTEKTEYENIPISGVKTDSKLRRIVKHFKKVEGKWQIENPDNEITQIHK